MSIRTARYRSTRIGWNHHIASKAQSGYNLAKRPDVDNTRVAVEGRNATVRTRSLEREGVVPIVGMRSKVRQHIIRVSGDMNFPACV
jgi:hypothetical protein